METIEITFSGASDDLVDISGCPGGDEFNCTMRAGPIDLGGVFLVTGPDGSMKVTAIYDGCWGFAVTQVDEGVPLPPWPSRLEVGGRGYSANLVLTVPKGTHVARLAK